MAITNINVNGVDYPLGGGGSSTINATLYFRSDPKIMGEDFPDGLIVRCDIGSIQDTDTVELYRDVNNRMRVHGETAARYHGWVKPRRSAPHFSKEYIGQKDGFDMWLVTVNGGTAVEYEESRGKDKLSLMRKCGIAICRDGVRISDFLKFRVWFDSSNLKYRLSRWK